MTNFVILCGGSGSRLWPKSREKLPKQLIKLTNQYTMLQNTILRIYNMAKKINSQDVLIIICNKEHVHIVKLQIEELDLQFSDYQIISETKGRDSAPAICISSLCGSSEDITFVFPCDHIFDDNEFANCCLDSLLFIEDSIVTFGITPTRIETGYGYIKTENYKTIEYIEKPNYENAKKYFEQGYLWNAGVFVFKNKNLIKCFECYAPDILENCKKTIYNSSFSTRITELSEEYFSQCRSISMDHAIMEKLCGDKNSPVEKMTITYLSHWNDIGSFSVLYDELPKEDDNVLIGDVVTLSTTNCYIESETLVATIGINNLVIVNTDDALLVCNKDQTQDVKKIVEYLKINKRDQASVHKKVFRPWGYYVNVYESEEGFKIKTIVVYPGKRLSLQSHNHRSEHWVIVKGNARVQLGTDEYLLNKDDHIYIPVKTLHRIENVGMYMLEFTETQIGNYLGEDDIIRYEDDYGRV